MFTEVFWSFFITSIIGCSLAVVRTMYKSKCKRFSCCGLLVERNVEAELELDEIAVKRISEEDKSIV